MTPDMRIYKEGDLVRSFLCVVRVPNFESAIELINKHEFGNGVSCYTRNGGTAREFARRVQIGMVGINVPIPSRWPGILSAVGSARSLATSTSTEEGIRFYTRYKSIMQRWPAGGALCDRAKLHLGDRGRHFHREHQLPGAQFVMPTN